MRHWFKGSESKDDQRERAAHGMADPEIQAILSDPIVRQVGDALSSQNFEIIPLLTLFSSLGDPGFVDK